jgi:hypothetical protein
MSPPWHDLAEKTVGSDDTIEKTYSCRFEKQGGYLCLGRKKMVFISVKGFLKKSYEVLFDASYDDISEVKLAGRYKIDIVHKGETRSIETSDISAKILVEAIQDIIKSSSAHVEISGL